MPTDNAFNVISFEISGAKVKEYILQHWLVSNNQTIDDIEKIELFVYGDYSGFCLGYPTGIYLKSGIRIDISYSDVLAVIETVSITNMPNYEVIYLKPEANEFANDDENIPIEKCDVTVLLKKRETIINDGDDAYMVTNAIIRHIDEMSSSWFSKFSYDDFFSHNNYGQKLVAKILEDSYYSYIEALIYSHLHKDRVSFVIARIFIDDLNKHKLISGEQKRLVQKLVTTDEPLNDYWKDELKKYLQ